jgi:hemoglobin-like flavoprotein
MHNFETAVTLKDLEIFNDSYERCSSATRFVERFYELFLAASPEVAEKFKNTDFRKQRRTLRASLYLMMVAVQGYPEGVAHLDRMAETHGPDKLDIRPGLYDMWLQCLLQAVRDIDPQFGPEVESSWRAVLEPGIEYMRARYEGREIEFKTTRG